MSTPDFTRPLTVRAVPDTVHTVLEEVARRECRSKQAQARVILTQWAEKQPKKET